jgi:hypothetical protein
MLCSHYLLHKSTSSTTTTLRKYMHAPTNSLYTHLQIHTPQRKNAYVLAKQNTRVSITTSPFLTPSTPPSLITTPTKPPTPQHSLPKTILHRNLPQPRQRPDLQPRLVRPQLDLHAEMPAPRGQPHEEVARPEKTAPGLDLLESLLVHGATSVAREDEESPQGPLAGMQAFIERSRCSLLASPSQKNKRNGDKMGEQTYSSRSSSKSAG